MSTINPPEYQQSPPQPPPLPPHRTWPRRHKILTALGAGFSLLVVLIIIIAATSAPSVTKPSTPATTAAAPATSAQPTTTPTPVAPSLTAAQQKFITDMSSQYNLGDGTTSGNAAVVTVGNDVCTSLKSGASESSIASALQQSNSGMSVSTGRRDRQPGRPRPLPADGPGLRPLLPPRRLLLRRLLLRRLPPPGPPRSPPRTPRSRPTSGAGSSATRPPTRATSTPSRAPSVPEVPEFEVRAYRTQAFAARQGHAPGTAAGATGRLSGVSGVSGAGVYDGTPRAC